MHKFSSHELGGDREVWKELAAIPHSWETLKDTFNEYVHTHIMTAQARESLRRDEQA